MVDWDRVEELRKKGRSWDEIASDPKASFKPDTAVTQAGPALRRLYYRRKGRIDRQGPVDAAPRKPDPNADKKWGLVRIGYFATPFVALWVLFAFIAPSPIGLLLSWFPWLLIILGVAVVILAFGLLRTSHRWSKTFRSTIVLGVVLGLVFTGLIALGALLSGCPFLPSSAALTSQPATGWSSTPSYVAAWQQNGMPVVFFYGSSWCPYCSASSWAIYKALSEFQSGFNPKDGSYGLPGAYLSYSSPTDVYAQTPEVVLANVHLTSTVATFVASEDTSGVDGSFPGTANCYQQAYVTAYSGSSIPFLTINGQFVHGGSTIIDPTTLSTYAAGAGGGNSAAQQSVLTQNGVAWNAVQYQAAWIAAFIVKASGQSLTSITATYNAQYQWDTGISGGTFTSQVQADLNQIV